MKWNLKSLVVLTVVFIVASSAVVRARTMSDAPKQKGIARQQRPFRSP